MTDWLVTMAAPYLYGNCIGQKDDNACHPFALCNPDGSGLCQIWRSVLSSVYWYTRWIFFTLMALAFVVIGIITCIELAITAVAGMQTAELTLLPFGLSFGISHDSFMFWGVVTAVLTLSNMYAIGHNFAALDLRIRLSKYLVP